MYVRVMNQETAIKHVSFERERGVYAVEVTPNVAHIAVHVSAEQQRTEDILRVLQTLASASIPIFLIKLHRAAISFALNAQQLSEAERCLKAASFAYSVRPDLAIVSVIASSMRDLTGVMVTIADALHEAKALMYGVGDAHDSVQCLIDGDRVEAAVSALKQTFALEETHG
jgi:aspartokinase